MKLQQLIHAERVHFGLSASDVVSALKASAEIFSNDLGVPADEIVRALVEREELGSTAVGHGFAIPHCKLQGISEIYLAIARFTNGVDFRATDGKPVQMMFIVLSPPDQPAAHLQVLSQIARVLKRNELREQLLRAGNEEELVAAVRAAAEVEGL